MIKLNNVFTSNLKDYEGNVGVWDIKYHSPAVYDDRWFIGDTCYLLARSVEFPGDGLNTGYAGSSHTGLLKAPIISERADLQPITITFLETNQSVADLFFRPWTIMVGHWSLKEQLLRTNITLTCFQKNNLYQTSDDTQQFAIRKQFVLEQAAPISIDAEEYNYTADKVIDRQIKFVYSRYHVLANDINADSRDMISTKYVPKKNLLDRIGDVVDRVNAGYNTVVNTVDKVQSGTTKALRLFGADKLANKVDQFATETIRGEVLAPVGEVIGTGNRYYEGALTVEQLLKTTIESGQNIVQSGQDISNVVQGNEIKPNVGRAEAEINKQISLYQESITKAMTSPVNYPEVALPGPIPIVGNITSTGSVEEDLQSVFTKPVVERSIIGPTLENAKAIVKSTP